MIFFLSLHEGLQNSTRKHPAFQRERLTLRTLIFLRVFFAEPNPVSKHYFSNYNIRTARVMHSADLKKLCTGNNRIRALPISFTYIGRLEKKKGVSLQLSQCWLMTFS